MTSRRSWPPLRLMSTAEPPTLSSTTSPTSTLLVRVSYCVVTERKTKLWQGIISQHSPIFFSLTLLTQLLQQPSLLPNVPDKGWRGHGMGNTLHNHRLNRKSRNA